MLIDELQVRLVDASVGLYVCVSDGPFNLENTKIYKQRRELQLLFDELQVRLVDASVALVCLSGF